MSKARELANLGSVTTRLDEVGNTDGALSNRNLIINGAMQVAQRGTSFSANGYHLDRWRTFNSGGTAILSQQACASGDSPEVGLDTYVRVVRASPTGIFYLNQRVEDVRKSDGATLTLSFYGRASTPTTVPCRIPQTFGVGGSAGVDNTAQDNNLTTVWQRFSVTFNMASLSGKTIGTGSYFDPVFDIPATTATIEITGVQLEVGDTATPFEHRSYGDELQRCMRYYYQRDWTETAYEPVFMPTWCNTPNSQQIMFYHPVEMRANPTCSHNGVGNFRVNNSTGQDETCNAITFTNQRIESAVVAFFKSTANLTVGDSGYINTEVNNDAAFYIDAEL